MKHKKFVTWIVLLMSVSLIAIITMQTFQLLNAYKKSRESIERGVSQAISNTLVTLQKQDAAIFVYDKLTQNSNTDADSVYPIDPYMIRSYYNQSITGYYDGGVHVQIQGFPEFSVNQYGYSFFKDISKPTDLFDIEKFLFEDFQQNKRRLQNIITQFEAEFSQRQIPVEKRFDAETIKCILYNSLLSQGLNIDFEFAIIDENNNVKIQSEDFETDNIKNCYGFNLIPGSIFSNPDVFMVYFPTKKKYALEAIYAQAGTSLLLTLLFIFTFGVSLYALLRQKKISEVKTDFINNMTHEFKTPIATIKLAAASIKNSKSSDNNQTAEHMIDIITQETSRMNQHVEQVLQMAVMERQSLKLNKSKENIYDIVKEAVLNIELVVEEKGGIINLDIDSEEIIVNADRDLLLNVFNNILDNAIKYSKEHPEIHVSSYTKSKKVYISIKDKGIGMSKEIQSKVFDRFYRAPCGNIHNIKGFGLGLNYAKEIINAHKGDIKVKSIPDKGSTFTIELSIKQKNVIK